MQLSEAFLLIFIQSIVYVPLTVICGLLLLTTFTPIPVILRYVRPPHFSKLESAVYLHFPSSLIRTILFSAAISIPYFRRFRHLGPIDQNVPLWFNLACRFYVYVVLGSATLWLTTLALMVNLTDFFW